LVSTTRRICVSVEMARVPFAQEPRVPEPYRPPGVAAVAGRVEAATVDAATAAPAVKTCRRLGLIELKRFLTGRNCAASAPIGATPVAAGRTRRRVQD